LSVIVLAMLVCQCQLAGGRIGGRTIFRCASVYAVVLCVARRPVPEAVPDIYCRFSDVVFAELSLQNDTQKLRSLCRPIRGCLHMRYN